MHTVTYSPNNFYSYANPLVICCVTVSCFGPLGQIALSESTWKRTKTTCTSGLGALLDPSAMAVFTYAQTNRTWGRNAPGFENTCSKQTRRESSLRDSDQDQSIALRCNPLHHLLSKISCFRVWCSFKQVNLFPKRHVVKMPRFRVFSRCGYVSQWGSYMLLAKSSNLTFVTRNISRFICLFCVQKMWWLNFNKCQSEQSELETSYSVHRSPNTGQAIYVPMPDTCSLSSHI